jgi:hypothetical protein
MLPTNHCQPVIATQIFLPTPSQRHPPDQPPPPQTLQTPPAQVPQLRKVQVQPHQMPSDHKQVTSTPAPTQSQPKTYTKKKKKKHKQAMNKLQTRPEVRKILN